MQFLYKIPGYILLLFGGFCLSWGGFIIRSFEEATVWQILLLRSVFFMIALMFFLIATYKKNTIKNNINAIMKKTDLINKICQTVASSNDLIIKPPQLKQNPPNKSSIYPGIL